MKKEDVGIVEMVAELSCCPWDARSCLVVNEEAMLSQGSRQGRNYVTGAQTL